LQRRIKFLDFGADGHGDHVQKERRLIWRGLWLVKEAVLGEEI
jgi:hypothetical protein